MSLDGVPMFVRDTHAISKRNATVEATDVCVWLYLSEPESEVIEKDVWLYNLIPAPEHKEIRRYKGQPPPAPQDVVHLPGTIGIPTEKNVSLRWSPDGESVAVWIYAELHAYILPESQRGYSRLIKVESPWGAPIDFDEYDKYLSS